VVTVFLIFVYHFLFLFAVAAAVITGGECGEY
jgi:hypothetical protein